MRARVYPAVGTAAAPATGLAYSLGVLRHRWWAVVLATLLGLAAGGGWMLAQERVWESTTSVLVHPAGQDTNVVGGRTQGEVNLDTEAQLVRSTAVARDAAVLLDPATPEPADDLAERVSVEVPPNTSVLRITFAGPSPRRAQAGAGAFAQAYLRQREQSARADIEAQTAAIEAKIGELSDTLTGINEQLAGTPDGSAAAANLESRRGTVASQLDTLTARLDELATATVTAGTVISEAPLPGTPSRPRPAIVLASGAALGLVTGVAAAGLADRLARRIHRPADLTRRLDVPVVATLDRATAPRTDEIASPYGPAGRAVDRLRTEVVAMLPPERDRARVVVITSVDSGTASSPVAANLAASLGRCGYDAVLVGAQASQRAAGGTLSGLLGVAPAPGLSEVLAGRITVPDALQRSPRHPRLQVLTMGATATAAGLLQSPALRAALAALATQGRYVVVDAPPTSASADAQGLASYADTALLVVERGRSLLAGAADAADQLRRVGTPLLGAVVLPPLPPRPEREHAAPAAKPTRGREPDRPTVPLPAVSDRAPEPDPAPAGHRGLPSESTGGSPR